MALRRFQSITLILPTVLLLFSAAINADEIPAAHLEFFENKIRPALIKYCYECHSEESGKTRGGLLVDTKLGLMQGGDSGPTIVPGEPEESLLWDAVAWIDSDYEMPPKQKMPDKVIADFKRWIEMGAPDPRVSEQEVVDNTIDIEAGKKHWAYQPIQKVSTNQSIDSYIDKALEEKSLQARPDASPEVLLRRLNFDIVGLPPTPAETIAFVKAWRENSEAALEKKVDELLASTQYGERWGRHWLDVARYAESTGLDVNYTFPHAWRYRDYVIDSYNQDKPYDQFVREQIAGDLLPAKTDQQWNDNLIATGFLAIGTKSLNEPNPRKFKMDVVDEQIDTVGRAILGLTVACARCHDHKYDAIPTMDYYALAGFFQSTDTFFGTSDGLQNRRPTKLLELPVTDSVSATKSMSAEERKQLEDRRTELRQRMFQLRSGTMDDDPNLTQKLLQTRAFIAGIDRRFTEVDDSGNPKTLAMGVQDSGTPGDGRVLIRGEVEKPAQEVARGFLQVLDFAPSTASIRTKQSGRRELATWLTSDENPLPPRVMVNRIWQKLFGEGLVSTPNNWGTTGEKPSHPELLDYLAARFIDQGWSIKSVIREIVLSNTYRRSSTFDQQSFAIDPYNRLLWRAKPRQIDAEALRDAMLAVSGRLELEAPHGSVIAQNNGRVGRQIRPGSFSDSYHRSIYLPVVRDVLPESLALFDFPDPSMPNAKRDETNMPSQALYLMNSDYVIGLAKAMAKRISTRFEGEDQRIRSAFLLAYSRPASADEVASCDEFLNRFAANGSSHEQAFQAFCQTLLSSAEFRILN